MAGKIIADTIEASGSQISLNVGNVTVITATSSGITGNVIGNVSTTGTATFSAGSAAAPSLTTSGDTNTGVFFPAADTVAIATGGTEAMRVNSSQNVGIGTSSPSARLHVYGTSAETLRFQSTSSAPYQTFYNSSANRAGYIEWNTSALKIDAESGASSTIAFLTANNERARINSSGDLLVNTTSSGVSAKFQVTRSGGTPAAIHNSGGTSGFFNQILFLNNAGTADIGYIARTNDTSVAYNTTSDYRLKENIAPMTGALAKVISLKPCTYTWKSNGTPGQGFIAHELAEVVPDAVCGEKDAVDEDGKPRYQGIDTSFLVATLTAAIQELTAKLTAAEARIAALEAK